MEIYVVQLGDTINSIAHHYGISVERLVSDNGLINPNALVQGQALVILYPKQTYLVKRGDTLESIADSNEISILQLVRNNPFLNDRKYIYPGESLVIHYNRSREIQVNGYTHALLNRDILKQALLYLTYLSIYNYRISENAIIISSNDDNEMIKLSKEYNTIPLLMISSFSSKEELNVEFSYKLLLDYEGQNKLINQALQIIKSKGYHGVNFLIGNITEYNQSLYLDAFTKISKVLRDEGYIFMLTISCDYSKEKDDSSAYENIDYYSISLVVDRIIFLQEIWGKKANPPAPVSYILQIRSFIEHVTGLVSPHNLSMGKPLMGLDWALPFTPNFSDINILSLNSAITLAYEHRAIIQLDEASQTPFYTYNKTNSGTSEPHIVWFIDVRSMRALDDMIIDYDLAGTGLWNIASYNQQLFSMINASFDIIKFSL